MDQKRSTMTDQQKSTMRKTIGWAGVAYGAFTALSIIGPIVLQRIWAKSSQNSRGYSSRKR